MCRSMCGSYADGYNDVIYPEQRARAEAEGKPGEYALPRCPAGRLPPKGISPQIFRNCADIRITSTGQPPQKLDERDDVDNTEYAVYTSDASISLEDADDSMVEYPDEVRCCGIAQMLFWATKFRVKVGPSCFTRRQAKLLCATYLALYAAGVALVHPFRTHKLGSAWHSIDRCAMMDACVS